MRWVTFTESKHSAQRAGLLVDGRIHACDPGTTLLGLLGDYGNLLAAQGDELRRDPHDVFELDAVQVLAPIPKPPTVRDFYAFEQHVRTARQRRDDERGQAEPQQCAPAESVAERSGGQQNCGERDVVGIDRPLRTRNAAAQICADRRQGQVDGVGIDESNEKAQVCRDQRGNR